MDMKGRESRLSIPNLFATPLTNNRHFLFSFFFFFGKRERGERDERER